MTERKYNLNKNCEMSYAGTSNMLAIIGVTVMSGILPFSSQSTRLEEITAGGFLIVGGALWRIAADAKAYYKTRVDYMNDQAETKMPQKEAYKPKNN